MEAGGFLWLLLQVGFQGQLTPSSLLGQLCPAAEGMAPKKPCYEILKPLYQFYAADLSTRWSSSIYSADVKPVMLKPGFGRKVFASSDDV